MTIYNYAKLTREQKAALISSSALMIDQYADKIAMIYVYYLNGFFIEITTVNGIETEHMPYKRGFKKSFLGTERLILRQPDKYAWLWTKQKTIRSGLHFLTTRKIPSAYLTRI